MNLMLPRKNRWRIVASLAVMVLLVVFVLLRVRDRWSTGDTSGPSKIMRVGQSTTFASANSGRPSTSLPVGVTPGTVLVSYIESYPFASITCEGGATKALDVVNGSHTRLVGCWKVASDAEPGPAATVAPPTEVSMVTMAFSGVAVRHPVSTAAGAAGVVSPSVATESANAVLVLGEGTDAWQAVAQPPLGAAIGASVNNGGNSQVAVASTLAGGVGLSRPSAWTTAPTSTAAASGSIALRPAKAGTTQGGPRSGTSRIAAAAPPMPTSRRTGPGITLPARAVPAIAPSSPPATVCGDPGLMAGPIVPPTGAVAVPAGDNSSVDWNRPGTTFWLAAGTHTLGTSIFSQIIPASRTTFVGAPGAVIDGQGINAAAFSTKVADVTVEYLTIKHFNSPGDQGVVNHDSGERWKISHNTITENHGAGTMIGGENIVTDNCLSNNGQYGFNSYSSVGGPRGVILDHNEITGNNTDDLEGRIQGCGCTGGGKFWQSIDATVTNNYVHDNRSVGLWADGDNVGFDAEGNYISGNDAEGMVYEVSYNAVIKNNTFIRNNLVKGPKIDGFPAPALYVSESGGDARVSTDRGYSTVDITGNVFIDNWDGVVLWENADRFCGNGETQFCTLVNPSIATLNTCVVGGIAQAPLYSDCRWKTQNVMVHDNTFAITKVNIPHCVSARTCGDQGLFSNFGTYPAFSPYRAAVIQDAITFHQNNRFYANTYRGDWHFIAHGGSTILDFSAWQARPYHQDTGSTKH